MTEHRELVHGHGGLVLSVDALVTDQACGRYHIGGHTISNEEDDVLGLAFLSKVANKPSSLGLAAVVVVEGGGVLAGFVQSNTAVGLGRNIDEAGVLCVASEEVYAMSTAILRALLKEFAATHPHTR